MADNQRQHAESVVPPEWDGQRWSAALADARWRHTMLQMRVKDALYELGEPTPDYPAPVANAVDILRQALAQSDGGGA